MVQPWLTIVTIVKDDPDGLARTLASLDLAATDDIEQVIVDGSSVPTPPAAVPGTARLVHQDPQGIYAAMNCGLAEARGRYVWFLNAGDAAASPEIPARLRSTLDADATWAHGLLEIVDAHGVVTTTARWDYAEEERRLFARGRFPAHQATIVRTDALRGIGGFDTTYRICADYKAALQLSRQAPPQDLGFAVARFVEGGVSTTHWAASVQEFHRARREVLQPRGWTSLRERADTVAHFARLGTYRTVIEPLRAQRSH